MATAQTRVFFDRKELDAAIGRGARLAFGKFGAFVRRRDQTSLKYRKKFSAPGQPPTVHRSTSFTRAKKNRKTGATSRQPTSPLRELISFAFDLYRRSLVVGPEVFRNSSLGGGKVPRVIEEGGESEFRSDGKVRVGRFQARPHLGPAFRAELPKAPAFIKDKIR